MRGFQNNALYDNIKEIQNENNHNYCCINQLIIFIHNIFGLKNNHNFKIIEIYKKYIRLF